MGVWFWTLYQLDSGCQNVSHHQQSFLEVTSPRGSTRKYSANSGSKPFTMVSAYRVQYLWLFHSSVNDLSSARSNSYVHPATKCPTQLFHWRAQVSFWSSLLSWQRLYTQVRQAGPSWWWVIKGYIVRLPYWRHLFNMMRCDNALQYNAMQSNTKFLI